ncbi:APC family permease [Burkholderia sp. Ac-20344]|uniref:APC family permease n=1 Tax=Burkholderia sp. Ac-20344 TaxID=2703890 RepID=UPI00197C4203|nr:APC family permease [Burkholderia sp. Ac-20344]MBN3836730.1 APC family permease [Burkholderia sp. Ac-20344]
MNQDENAGEGKRKLSGNMGAVGLALTVLAFSAPLTSVSGYIPFGIIFGGVGTPLVYALTTIAMLLFTVGYMALNNIVKRPGDFYSFVSFGIGKSTGLGAGILATVAYLLILSGVCVFFGLFASSLQKEVFGSSLPWYVYGFGCWLLVAILGYLHVELSTKVLTWVMILEVLTCVSFSLFVLHDGGVHDIPAIAPFLPSSLSGSSINVPFAVLFAVSMFLGFEATALFRDEVRTPDKTIPRATYGAVILIGLLYTLCSYALVIAYGANAQAVATKSPDTMFSIAFAKFVNARLHILISVLVLTSCFASCLSIQNVLSRYLHNLGSDKALPAFLGRVHAKHQSPYLASISVSSITFAILCATVIMQLDPNLVYGRLSGVGTAGVAILMTIVNFASLQWYLKAGKRAGAKVANSFAAPALSAVFFLWMVYLVAKHFELLVGGQPGECVWMLYALVAIQVAGTGLGVYYKFFKPAVFQNLGRSLAESADIDGGPSPDSGMSLERV